jgi:hypothetical protein
MGRGENMPDELRNFEEVLDAELRLLRTTPKGSNRNSVSKNILTKASKSNLVGLALSGGGIRSATFNLGVLQALASFKILEKIDYLSTVSGGGYIGTWLTAMINRAIKFSEVERLLGSSRRSDPSEQEPEEIRFLRDYSNYLTPRTGLLGMDLWTVIVSYLRNLTLNLIILVFTLMALLVIPVLSIDLYSRTATFLSSDAVIIFALLLFIVAGSGMVSNLSSMTVAEDESPGKLRYQRRGLVLFVIIVPVIAGAFLLNHWLWYNQLVLSPNWYDWAWVTGLVYAVIWGIGSLSGYLFRSKTPDGGKPAPPSPSPGNTKKIYHKWIVEPYRRISMNARQGVAEAADPQKGWQIGVILFSGFVAGCVGGPLLMIVTQWVSAFSNDDSGGVILGVPLIILVMTVVATLHIGFTGRGFSEEAREWWSRLGAYIALIMLSLTAFFTLALYGSDFLGWLQEFGSGQLLEWMKAGVVSGWLLTTVAGIVAGRSSKTGEPGGSKWMEVVGKVAPYVFVLGLVLILQQLTDTIVTDGIAHYVVGESPLMMFLCVVGFLSAAFLLSWRISVNDFSMHALYRNRLVRCYLGASNKKRNPQPFTNIDPMDDNIRIQDLLTNKNPGKFTGPYPIVNAALNLAKGSNLAWQERKAASFTFTPQYSGYEHIVEKEEKHHPGKNLADKGFRRSEWYGDDLTLGNVMAISGAAASPNMGYHTSPPLAFLMTIFNVRLGSWLGNPRYNIRKAKWRHDPPIGLFYLIFELFGKTNDASRYVYLSDGGHFENLGVYELVRRRCSLIIASDAGEDRNASYGDLGNAIEKCRTDFGIDIELDVSSTRPDKETGMSKKRFAVGKVRYDRVDPKAPVGTILYLKASLTGHEPTDVLRYKAQMNDFPHQSTTDQWFDESQFESYRMLGYDILRSAFQPIGQNLSRVPTRKLISAINLKCSDTPGK